MSEIPKKRVCCTCLSTDRKLYPLYKILDGINLLYMLLTHDPEAYKEGFYADAASLLVCWECRAVIFRIKRFRRQVCVARKHLADVAEGRNNINKETFSHLTVVHNRTHYQFESGFLTNFVDCGSDKEIKHESDSDDIPLSAFCYNNSDCEETINCDILPENTDIEASESNINFDSSNINSVNSNMKPGNSSINTAKINAKLKTNIDEGDSNIYFDSSNINSVNSNMKPGNSSIKPAKIKSTSKKKTKMKYKKYFSITTMNEQEMRESIERRKMELQNDAFKCDYCVITFKTENKLLNHDQDLHTQKGNHSLCDICHAYIEDLFTHRQSHYYLYNCTLCTHTAHTHTDIVRHIKKDHYEICKESKSSKKKMKRKCSEESKYPCTECGLNFQNKDLRWKHIQKAHREGFKCSSCGKKFAFKNNLERHERIHSGPLPREECPICRKLIRTDLLKVHSRIHTHRQRYTCVECDKHFVCRETYESHLKYAQPHATVDVCRHQCGVCEKRYRSRGELRDHVNYQHNGQAAHKCPICNKGLATKRCIRRHVRRAHEGIKESAKDKICQQCGKAFRDKKGLVEHERVHSGARPLACSACGRAFRQRAALHAHTRRLHRAK